MSYLVRVESSDGSPMAMLDTSESHCHDTIVKGVICEAVENREDWILYLEEEWNIHRVYFKTIVTI